MQIQTTNHKRDGKAPKSPRSFWGGRRIALVLGVLAVAAVGALARIVNVRNNSPELLA